MKKKMSLIDLNNNEIKKNQMKQLLTEEVENTKGGAFPKCWFPMCLCWCSGSDSFSDDNSQFQEEWEYIRDFG
jgi:hypothetical protein